MVKFKFIKSVLFLLVLLLISGCSEQKNNSKIPENIEEVKLDYILKNQSKYTDTLVVLNGIYAVPCGASCCPNEFSLKDGINSIKVSMAINTVLPKIAISKPVRVFGTLKATAQSPYILAEVVEER